MRAGELVRRLLTAIVVHDLVDIILNTKSRVHKIGDITTNIAHKPPTPLARALTPQLGGRLGADTHFDAVVSG